MKRGTQAIVYKNMKQVSVINQAVLGYYIPNHGVVVCTHNVC